MRIMVGRGGCPLGKKASQLIRTHIDDSLRETLQGYLQQVLDELNLQPGRPCSACGRTVAKPAEIRVVIPLKGPIYMSLAHTHRAPAPEVPAVQPTPQPEVAAPSTADVEAEKLLRSVGIPTPEPAPPPEATAQPTPAEPQPVKEEVEQKEEEKPSELDVLADALDAVSRALRQLKERK